MIDYPQQLSVLKCYFYNTLYSITFEWHIEPKLSFAYYWFVE